MASKRGYGLTDALQAAAIPFDIAAQDAMYSRSGSRPREETVGWGPQSSATPSYVGLAFRDVDPRSSLKHQQQKTDTIRYQTSQPGKSFVKSSSDNPLFYPSPLRSTLDKSPRHSVGPTLVK